jgi:hypothetical protein
VGPGFYSAGSGVPLPPLTPPLPEVLVVVSAAASLLPPVTASRTVSTTRLIALRARETGLAAAAAAPAAAAAVATRRVDGLRDLLLLRLAVGRLLLPDDLRLLEPPLDFRAVLARRAVLALLFFEAAPLDFRAVLALRALLALREPADDFFEPPEALPPL